MGDQQPADSVHALFLLNIREIDIGADFVEARDTGYQQMPLFDFGNAVILVQVEFVAHFPNDFFQQIFQRDDTCRPAVLVNHHGHVDMTQFEGRQQFIGGQGFRHKRDFMHQFANLKRRAVQMMMHEIFQMDDADDMFQIIFIDRETGMRRGEHLLHQVLLADCDRDRLNARARDHDLTGTQIGKVKDIGEQHLFFGFHQPTNHAVGDDQFEFIRGVQP